MQKFALLGTLLLACLAHLGAADPDDPVESTGPGHPLALRDFAPGQVQQALDETEARQRDFYEGHVAKGHHKGVLAVLGSVLGRYGLDRDVGKANTAMETRYEKALAGTNEEARGPWYNFGLEQRLYFLFGSRSKIAPGRMSPAAEKIVLDKMWEWARPTTRLEMTLPERDWWSLGSENHWTHLWTGMWGAAQIFADHPDYRDRKYDDGTPVAQMAKAFDERFKRFCRDRASKGLLVECNSAYNKQTLSGLYNIVDFASDPVLKNRMRMLLDIYWADWATEQMEGIRGGSRHRCYPDAHATTEASAGPLAWYHFGVGDSIHNLAPDAWTAATTQYRPDPLVVEMVLDTKGRGNYASVSRRLGLRDPSVNDDKLSFIGGGPKNVLDVDKIQVLAAEGGGLLRYSWCTPDYVMGTSMVEARPKNDWVNFSSQNRWDGVLFGGHSTARIFVQSQGVKGRSFYNANWSVQSKGVLVLQRLKDGFAEEARGQRIWFDDSLKRVEKNGWIFAEAPRAYAAVRVVEGGTEWKADIPFKPDKGDVPGPGKYLTCQSEFSPVIMESARKSDYPDFAAFQNAILANALTWKESKLEYRSAQYQTSVTMFADYSRPPLVDGQPLNYRPVKVYDSPFIQGDFGQGVVTLSKGDRKVVLDFNKE